MGQAITFIVFFVMFQLLFLALRQRLKIKMLESDKERIERSRDRWKAYYNGYIQKLENKVDELTKRRISDNSNVSPDTIQAVKYAMKHAHPDNGGNTDDFIRFQKCYEELTRK